MKKNKKKKKKRKRRKNCLSRDSNGMFYIEYKADEAYSSLAVGKQPANFKAEAMTQNTVADEF